MNKLTDNEIKEQAINVIEEEARALLHLKTLLTNDFARSLHLIARTNGRLIVTGIGKSAIVAQKMVATFNSTGTPAIFMHAADAIHGDLGIIQPEDVILCLSKSGNTPEISVLVPFLKRCGNPLIAMTGNADSLLAKEADFFLNCHVEQEACPHNLAPTSSTTVQLVLGDAMAACLIKMRGFTADDFARYHPGGILGKMLLLSINDLYKKNAKPEVSPHALMPEVILEISGKRLGVTAVTENGQLIGAITDGDLRRMLQNHTDYTRLLAHEVMTKNPKTVQENTLASEALAIMKKSHITNIFVVDSRQYYLGVIHMHDILKEGIY
ncbi:MAG: KpsF/GutQ family sugar-phosphate isomerase [Bacteroidales bacterium]|jgi:arabinose-5-phosphate isomerase|nr:KpsF/GutQ family sugar-phosphate isomerase [Bacteroidales bacterium]